MKKTFIKIVLLTLTFTAIISAADLKINEFMASNSSGLQDPDNNAFVDWIELYNSGSSPITLDGYTLTDSDPDPITGVLDTIKWAFSAGTTIGAGQYLIIYADKADSGLHTNFKLSSLGENLALYNPSRVLVDGLVYPEQVSDKSYGKNSLDQWVYLENPTPGAVNNESESAVDLITKPIMEPESGNYSSNVSISLTSAGSNSIYYTKDGSTPTTSSAKYSGSISLSSSSIIKAISVNNDGVSSGVTAQSYIVNETHDLPIVSLTAFHYDSILPAGSSQKKLLIDGKVYVDFIEKDGSKSISQFADFEKSGNSSESLPQLNGKIYSKEKYGEKYFNYKMFPNKDVAVFRCFTLRNASQDQYLQNATHMRDGLISRIISTGNIIDMPFEGYRPAALYVNGKYEGLINIREDDDKYYAQANYDQDLSDYQKENTSFSSGLDIRDSSTHEAYAKFINLHQMYFHQSLLTGFCGQSEDGARIWRDSVLMTQFQYHIHDYDQALALANPEEVTIDPAMFIGIVNFSETEKAEMLQFYAAQINLLYDTTRTLPIFDAVVSEIRSEIPQHAQKNVSDWESFEKFTSLSQWDNNVAILRNAVKVRPAAMLAKTVSTNSLTTVKLTHEVNDLTMGEIAIHSIKSTEKKETGTYFSDFPLRIEAIAKPGYIFDHWEGASTKTDDSISITLNGNTSIKAVFIKDLVGITINRKVKKEISLGITKISQKTISLSIPSSGKYEISIYSLNGREIMKQSKTLFMGHSNISWGSDNIAQGIVFVQIKGMSKSFTTKLIVQ